MAITEPIRRAIDWISALDADGDLRRGTEICEITGLLPADLLATYPQGTRFIVRRERPRPGAQPSLFDAIEGMRHQVMATDTPTGNGSIQFLEARRRAQARVEDRIRCGKDTGFGRFPSRVFAIHQAWPDSPSPASTYSPGPKPCSWTADWPCLPYWRAPTVATRSRCCAHARNGPDRAIQDTLWATRRHRDAVIMMRAYPLITGV